MIVWWRQEVAAVSIGQLFGYAYGVALFASQRCYLPFGLCDLEHF